MFFLQRAQTLHIPPRYGLILLVLASPERPLVASGLPQHGISAYLFTGLYLLFKEELCFEFALIYSLKIVDFIQFFFSK